MAKKKARKARTWRAWELQFHGMILEPGYTLAIYSSRNLAERSAIPGDEITQVLITEILPKKRRKKR